MSYHSWCCVRFFRSVESPRFCHPDQPLKHIMPLVCIKNRWAEKQSSSFYQTLCEMRRRLDPGDPRRRIQFMQSSRYRTESQIAQRQHQLRIAMTKVIFANWFYYTINGRMILEDKIDRYINLLEKQDIRKSFLIYGILLGWIQVHRQQVLDRKRFAAAIATSGR